MTTDVLGGALRTSLLRLAAVVALMLFVAAGGMVWAGLPTDQTVPEPAVFADAPPPALASTTRGELPPANTLSIPALGISAPLVAGRVSAGSLEIPSDPTRVTLWTGGGRPCGRTGTVLVAGHVSSFGTRGALWNLHRVTPATIAQLTCPDRTVTTWYANRTQIVHKDALPSQVYAPEGDRRLVVVTCGGPLLDSGHYRDNVLVWFEEVG